MLKHEIICQACDAHFVVAADDHLSIDYCPCCSFPIIDTEQEENGQ